MGFSVSWGESGGESGKLMIIVWQSLTKESVMRHLEAEKAAGRQIFPAFAGLGAMNENGKQIDMSKLLSINNIGVLTCVVCKQLECGVQDNVLAW